jgi:hypothetical protein
LKAIGCLLLVSGFFVALAALVLMRSLAAEMVFVVAAMAVEALGFSLLMNGHRTPARGRR